MYAWIFWAWTVSLLDLQGHARDPFSPSARAHVFLFVRSDCPITNRYAPEWTRIVKEFSDRGVHFALVYPDRDADRITVAKHITEYRLAGQVLLDPMQQFVRQAHITTAPEAAVFNARGQETYHGRIDDLYVSPGRSRPGGAHHHDLELAIQATLESRPVQQPVTQAIGCSLADVR